MKSTARFHARQASTWKKTANNTNLLAAKHKFHHVSATVGGLTEKYFIPADAPWNTEAETQLELQGDLVQIKSHLTNLPFAKAFFGTLLVSVFDENDLDIDTMIDCSNIGGLAQDYADANGVSGPIKSAMASACMEVLANLAVELTKGVMNDIAASGLSGEIDFVGSASFSTLADGKAIAQIG